MSGWKFSFPVSRTCLWNHSPTGEAVDLSLTKEGWVSVEITSSCLQLAVSHAQSSNTKTLNCFLIASSWINEEIISLEVNRFDPGRPNKDRTAIAPTSLMPGDIAVETQVVVGSHPDSKYLTHNLNNLQDTIDTVRHALSQHHQHATPLCPAHLMSLRIHCSCSHDGMMTVQCGCVFPSTLYQATPINTVRIVETALARNLSGPLPLSALQSRIRHGYVTMEATRKLVLLLHSDPIASSLPLIGVWVSGVDSVHHPLVWTACMAYTTSTTLRDRVWGDQGDTFVCLVYCEGCSQPSFWQCRVKDCGPEWGVGGGGGGGEGRKGFGISTGEAVIQPSSKPNLLRVSLCPALQSTAMHTLLETALSTTTASHAPFTNSPAHIPATPSSRELQNLSFDSPLPSPMPTPSQAPERVVRDKNLSVISCLDATPPRSPRIAPASPPAPLPSPPSPSSRPSPPAPPSPHLAVHSSMRSLSPGQQDTPTSHMTTQSIRMTQEDQQKELEALKEKVECLLQAQYSPNPANSTATLSPLTLTADASTSVGTSLCIGSATPLESVGSVGSATPTCSSLSYNYSLDLPSIPFSSDSYSQTSDESLPTSFLSQEDGRHDRLHCPTPTITAGGPQRNQSCEEIMADVLEKLQRLNEQESRNNNTSSSPSDSSDHHTDSEQTRGFTTAVPAPAELREKLARLDLAESCDRTEREVEPTRVCVVQQVSPDVSQVSCTSARGERWREEGGRGSGEGGDSGEDKTLTPPTPRNRISDDDVMQMTPPLNNTTPPLNHNQPHPPPPWTTPLSTKNGNYLLHPDVAGQYLLHPDVLNRQFSPDISMLPVPRIMCPPTAGNSGWSLDTFVLGSNNEYTIDENVYHADMITMKYLGDVQGVGHGAGSQQQQLRGTGAGGGLGREGLHTRLRNGGAYPAEEVGSNDHTLLDMSMATQQYLHRHNLLAGRGGGVAATPTKAQNKWSGDDVTLNIQALKSLPKLT